MITVIIPTLNAERTLPLTLAALLEAHIDGLVREVIVADCGSQDMTARIVDEAGATFLSVSGSSASRAVLKAAADAKFPWLLVLQPGTAPEPGFERVIANFIRNHTLASAEAGFLKFAAHDGGLKGFVQDQIAALKTRVGFAPQPEQGLLIERRALAVADGSDADAAMAAALRAVHFKQLNARIVVLGAQRSGSAAPSVRETQVSLANR
jgi:Glycosyl transferase family 2